MAVASVFVPYVLDGLKVQTWEAVQAQFPRSEQALLSREDLYAYAKWLRERWHESGHLCIVEQDVVPPERSIDRLLGCPEEWCVHPHWIDGRYVVGTLALVKFSEGLKGRLPELADRALGRFDPLWAGSSHLWMNGSFALRWPTTVEWGAIDFRMKEQLEKDGVQLHVHPEPTIHLHDYGESSDPQLSGLVIP